MVTFVVEYAKSGRSSCKALKRKIEKEEIRIGKLLPNPFSDDDDKPMATWYCLEGFVIANERARKHKVDSVDDLEGFEDLEV
eukprot:2645-Amorphochlora_amoeboformis.AAC.2